MTIANKGSAASRLYLKETAFKLLEETKLTAAQTARILEISSLRKDGLILEADYYLGIIEIAKS